MEPVAPSPPPSLPPFVSVSFEPLHAQLYDRVFRLILDKGLFFNGSGERREPPYKFRTPSDLKKEIDFKLGANGAGQEAVYRALEKVIELTPHYSHPFFVDKISPGRDPYGIIGDYMASLLSSIVVTYFFGPLATLMEEEVKRRVRGLIGYSELQGDGIICPGSGFAANMALKLALHKKYPDLKAKGLAGISKPRLCVFVSGQSGETMEKAAFLTGLGSTACIEVQTEEKGRMDMSALKKEFRRALASNLVPLMVVATAGTPTLGAIDPIDQIGDFCAENNLWLHVDGTYGGSYMFYEEGMAFLKGIEKSDSYQWSPSTMLGAPFSIDILVTKYEKLCLQAFGTGAAYVFEPTTLYDTAYDNGDSTIQTTRRAEIMKLWLMWKAKGQLGLGSHVRYVHDLSKICIEEVTKRSPKLKLILNDYDTSRVSFYYDPINNFLVNTDGRFNARLKNHLLERGIMSIGLSKIPGYNEFLTIAFTNSAVSRRDVQYLLDQIIYHGDKMSNPLSAVSSIVLGEPKDGRKSYPSYVNAPIESDHRSLFEKVFALAKEKSIYFEDKRNEKPYNFREPQQLLKEFDFSLATEPITDDEKFLEVIDKIIFYSIHQAHPYYVYQLLSGGLDPYSILADLVLTTMSTPMLSYEDSPAYTLMEEELFRASRELLGYPNGIGDGLLSPGGSIAIISAIYLARYSKYPETKEAGLSSKTPTRLVLYISEAAHYCSVKGSLLQGS